MAGEKTSKKDSLNRIIFRMTVPTVLSNISVPLLGLCDTAVAGHMAGEKYLAGIAIGSVMVSTVYWLFGFLRAGTSGITANAYGANDSVRMGRSLLRSAGLGIVLGLFLMAVHSPVLKLLQEFMGTSEEVTVLSGLYFSICVMGAVPMMVLTAITGWMIGMQSTSSAMAVNIGMSIINVLATITLVYGFDFGFDGIALGTLSAQWLMLIPALWIAARICRRKGVTVCVDKKLLVDKQEWRYMLNVNSNLFFRSACLIALTMMLYAYSARLGDVEVSSNAIINQMFLFFSYFMDGFAFTGEALTGRYNGAADSIMLRKSHDALLKWTAGITVLFVALYSIALPLIVGLLTDSKDVASCVASCWLWVACLPIAGAPAFIYDGFYIGLTRTRPMLVSTFFGVALFVVLLHTVSHTQWMLWMSFTCYLALRSAILVTLFPRKTQKLESSDS